MAERKIRVGIIGASTRYGWGRQAHLQALLALPEYELAAVCTADRETAEESAKHYGAELAFHDYKEMVKHPDIDLVSVCVRAPLHHQMLAAALEAGKHVLCEWPLGANLREAEELAGLARSKGVCHMIGLQARCDPVVLRIRELLAEGYVGEVLCCNMALLMSGILQLGRDRAWAADRAKGGDTLCILAGHALDILCFCAGEFKEISAHVTTQVPVWDVPGADKTVDATASDNVAASGVLTSGAVASVHVAHVPWHGTGWRMQVYGREGTLIASASGIGRNLQIRLLGRRSHELPPNATAPGNCGELEELPVPERLTWVPGEVPRGAPFNVAQMYRRLGEAIRKGKCASPDFDLAVKRHRLLDGIQRSSDLGVRQRC